jgi:hypothetical protein
MPSKHGKGWRARWLDEHGERHSRTFRFHRDAEAFERRKKAESEEVTSGLRAARPVPRSFGSLCDYWIENRASQKRSKIHDESIIRSHLRPVFGVLNVGDVQLAQVDRFVHDRAHLSPKTISNVLTLLIAMLNVAKDLGWVSTIPRISDALPPIPGAASCVRDSRDNNTGVISDTEVEGTPVSSRPRHRRFLRDGGGSGGDAQA